MAHSVLYPTASARQPAIQLRPQASIATADSRHANSAEPKVSQERMVLGTTCRCFRWHVGGALL